MKVYKFYANWCQPCKMLSKILEDVDTNGHEIIEVDIDNDESGLANRYGVRGIPALVMIDENKAEIKRLNGLQNENKLKEWFK